MEEYNTIFKKQYKELLSCNADHKTLVNSNNDTLRIQKDLIRYATSIKNGTNYNGFRFLHEWNPEREHTPLLASKILDIIQKVRPKNVCEIGAGAGIVARYVREVLDDDAKLTAIESLPNHFKHLNTHLNNHFMLNRVRTLNLSAHKLDIIKDMEFDCVYTSEVLMHIPFLVAVGIISEIARVSSKYIIHCENVVSCLNKGDTLEKEMNECRIDYVSLYDKLGFTVVSNDVYPYKNSHHSFICILLERCE